MCGLNCYHIWTKWHDKPIKMSINEKGLRISAIPFPVVTICPQTKCTQDKLDLIAAYDLVQESAENNLTKKE